MNEEISVRDLERKVYELDEIRIVIRVNKDTKCKDHIYKRKVDKNMIISDWLETRVKPLLDNLEVDIIDGKGQSPHPRTKIEDVRNSYIK